MTRHYSTAVHWPACEKVAETSAKLALLQSKLPRELWSEKILAAEATRFLQQKDTNVFTMRLRLSFRNSYTTRYHPRSLLAREQQLLKYVLQKSKLGSLEEVSKLQVGGTMIAENNFQQFSLGADLGYPEELGQKWYIVLGSMEGFCYIPVEDLLRVVSASLL